ncbi:hypothetical protein M9Y10_038161 [Tritrichomonas musculus]|uniref:Dynein heavy chain tail domain-containing protein n=1 Tax=Tritrichomonas musculus TaxID=1915356 RepID=A0ABR2K7M1_9EUKA
MDAEVYEFITLCKKFFNGRNKSTQPLRDFFSRIMKGKSKLPLTADVREYIPKLAQVEDGLFINMLSNSVDGITPLHFVPDLQLAPRPPRKKRNTTTSPPPRRCQTTRDDLHIADIKVFMQTRTMTTHNNDRHISKPQTLRSFTSRSHALDMDKTQPAYLRPLPPLKKTDDEVISELYAGPQSAFFIAKKENPTDEDLKIVPPEYPERNVGKRFSILTKKGVVSLEGKKSDITDLDLFVQDKTDFFLTKHNVFREKLAYQSFYTWRNRYKVHHFDSKIKRLNDINATIAPGFNNILDRIRENFLTVTSNLTVFPASFDNKNDDAPYGEMTEAAEKMCASILEATTNLCDETSRLLAQFFNEIQLTKEMMKLNFNELNELNALSPGMKRYSSDLKYRTPSIYREKQRQDELKTERKYSKSREEYIPKFYRKVRALYSGLLVIRCRETILDFLSRFDSTGFHENRATKFTAAFDNQVGLILSPNNSDFVKWANGIISKIKDAFLNEERQLPLDLITAIDPSYNTETEDLYKTLSHYKEIDRITTNIEVSSDSAFEFFNKELQSHKDFLVSFQSQVDEISKFTDIRNNEGFKSAAGSLIQLRQDIEKRPRLLFHKVTANSFAEVRADFVVDLKPCWEVSKRRLEKELAGLKERALNELNNNLFNEIQEKYVSQKEKKKLSKIDVGAFEARCLIYSLMCGTIVSTWPQVTSEIRAGLDTVAQMYQQIANISKYVHAEVADSFNMCCERVNVPSVKVQEGEEEEEQDEDEYEYVDEEEVNEK